MMIMRVKVLRAILELVKLIKMMVLELVMIPAKVI